MYCIVNVKVYVKSRLQLVMWLARRGMDELIDNLCTDLWLFEQVDENVNVLHCKLKSRDSNLSCGSPGGAWMGAGAQWDS